MFADDLILFGTATEAQISVVLDILAKFYNSSGQCINMDKTNFFFSNDTPMSTRKLILPKYDFKETSSFGTYLGVPISGKHPWVIDYQYHINKVQSKLDHWKRNQFSFSNRVTLVKAVIEALPTYTMMYVPIPQACIKKIQHCQRSFIWGDPMEKKHIHSIR